MECLAHRWVLVQVGELSSQRVINLKFTGPSQLCYHSVMLITQEADKWTASA